jgi:2-polyprenyl-6-methoxyphenol hydroxylase-like FAD-dependent oxidoreductase
MVPPASPSLAFIKDDDLMAILRKELSGDIEWDSTVSQVFRRGQKAVLQTDDGRQFEADLVIAADGQASA